MKVGFVGDPHYSGSQSFGGTDSATQLNTRLLDFSTTFNNIIDEFERRDVKVVAIVGDNFDTRYPSPQVVKLFSQDLQRAADKGMTVLLLAGNHDQLRTTATTTIDVYNALTLPNIKSFPDFAIYTVGNVNFIMMPYRDKKMMDVSKTKQEATDKIKEKIDALSVGLKGKKICMGHYMVGETVAGDEQTFSIDELVLPLSTFDGFDATFIGHIHTYKILQKNPPIIYVGSMEKITMGDRLTQKVSIVLDTDTMDMEIIPTKTRDLFEIDLNYADGDKYYKALITDQVIADIEEFGEKNVLEGAIIKLTARVKENDSYFVDQDRIREYITKKKVSYLSPLQVSTITNRKLRNKNITETVDSKKAMSAFIRGLTEPENTKKKLLDFANKIIEQVEGK